VPWIPWSGSSFYQVCECVCVCVCVCACVCVCVCAFVCVGGGMGLNLSIHSIILFLFSSLLYYKRSIIAIDLFFREKFSTRSKLQTNSFYLDKIEIYSSVGKAITALDLPNPAPDWLDKRMWGEIASLSTLPAFHGLADDVRTLL
jgi:hypothetical protein